MTEKDFYRRRLPHLQPKNATFFVTTGLAGSLPVHVIHELKEEQAFLHKQIENAENEETRKRHILKLQSRYFGKFDEYVNQISVGPRWLSNDKIAGIVAEALQHRNGTVYDLL